MKDFPVNFAWGAATCAYQIEGGADAHGRGQSVWDAFCRVPGAIQEGATGDVACDHIHRYKEDVEIMRRMGLEAYRLSISWPRVMPEGAGAVSESGLAFYDRLIDELLGAGVDPWVTLFHWDYPLALHHKGGWLNPASPCWFEEYARTVVDRLSDRVSHWITINEPQVFIGLGYGSGKHAPGLRLSWPEQVLISHQVLVAHGRAARVIRERARTHPRIGWAPVGIVRFPVDSQAETVRAATEATFAAGQSNVWNNSWFNDPVCLGRYPEDGLKAHGRYLPECWERDLEVIHQPLDFFGVNIYRGDAIRLDPDGNAQVVSPGPGSPRSAFGWEITPPVMYWGPRLLHERYGLPIVITENGFSNLDWPALDGCVHDPQRVDYLARHLLELRRALADGIAVQGYFCWSLLDNFEWADGFRQRFGLVHVDFQTQKRTLKDSAHWYAQVIRTRGASLDPVPTVSVKRRSTVQP